MAAAENTSLPERPSGVLYRVVQALTGVLLLICLICGFLGLRAIVWRHESELPVMLQAGLIIAGVIGGILALLYILLGERGIRFVMLFDWMSVQMGLVTGMLLYGIYNAISPLLFTYANEPMGVRALQGAVDGALIGAFIGLLIGFIDHRPVTLTRPGAIRYAFLFLLVMATLSAAILVGNQPNIPRNVTVWLLIPIVFGLRLLVNLYDRFQERKTKS